MQDIKGNERQTIRATRMAHDLHRLSPVARAAGRGFTLVEMMIVVAIIGILATLAVVGYRKIVQSSHVSEATSMVQNIRVAQEGYHSETQQYANVSPGFPSGAAATATSILFPNDPKYGFVSDWHKACTFCNAGYDWSVLPLHVDGPVIFGYATIAGVAGTAPVPGSVTVNGGTMQLPTSPATDWYCIGAEADLDGNPNTVTNVFGFSWSNQVYVSNEGL